MDYGSRILTPISNTQREEWLFFRLLLLSLFGAIAVAYGLLKLISGSVKDHNVFFIINIGAMVFLLIAITTILLLGIKIFTDIKLPYNEKTRKITISFFFPFIYFLGKILRIRGEQIQESFLKINNKLIRINSYNIPSHKILLLLPRCLQRSNCAIKLNIEGDNCQKCGLCEIKDIWDIVNRYKVKLAIATGGELARQFIEDAIPKAVVAVACTKEIILGIQDTYPLLVLSVVNEWPNGPCIDTIANLDRVEEAIKFFLGDKQSNPKNLSPEKS